LFPSDPDQETRDWEQNRARNWIFLEVERDPNRKNDSNVKKSSTQIEKKGKDGSFGKREERRCGVKTRGEERKERKRNYMEAWFL